MASATSAAGGIAQQGSVYRVRASAWLRAPRRPGANPPGRAPSADVSNLDRAALDAALAQRLVPYVQALGFTHLQLLAEADGAPSPGALPVLRERCGEAGLTLVIADDAALQDDAASGRPPTDGAPTAGDWRDDANALVDALEAGHRHPADRATRFAALRAALAWHWALPGRRALTGGDEFAQTPATGRGPDTGLAWHLLADPLHEGVQRLVHDLNRLRLDAPAVLRAWDGDGHEGPVRAFMRHPADGALNAAATDGGQARPPPPGDAEAAGTLLVVTNRSPESWPAYRVAVPAPGRFVERIATTSSQYTGAAVGEPPWVNGRVDSEAQPWAGCAHSVVLRLPAFATLVMQRCG